jgi:hypothetical protein
MSRFIESTLTLNGNHKQPILININEIMVVKEYGGKCLITMAHGDAFNAKAVTIDMPYKELVDKLHSNGNILMEAQRVI